MKKTLVLVLTIISLVSVLLGNVAIASAATTYDAQKIVEKAESYLGSTSFGRGYCLKFVRMMFQEQYGFYSSACCAYNYGTKYIDSTSQNNIPIGADVFFTGSSSTCSSCGKKCGHIGIYVGNGYIIHNWSGKIQKHKISDITKSGSYSYRGWGWHGNKSFTTTSTETINSINSNTYQSFKNVKSGKYCNVYYSRNKSGTNVTIYAKDYTSGQDFKPIAHGTMTYKGKIYTKYYLVPRCSTSCALNVYGTVSKNGSNVNIWTKSGNSTQDWIFEKVNGGYVIRSANNPTYVLTASGTANSSNVKLTTYSSGNTYQIWTIS